MSKKTRNTLALRLVLPLVFVGLFAFNVPHAHAMWNPFSSLIDTTASGILYVFNFLLYCIFLVAGFLISIGATMLEFVLDPFAFNGLFNLSAVYDLWRMIRDFFNLFIILMILFIAFATIFQVQAFSYKKLLWHLVLMALLVNFSFPVTRFIIDTANVPMYFFLDNFAPDSATGGGGRLSSELFKASDLQSKILPGSIKVTKDSSSPNFDYVQGSKEITFKLIEGTIFVFIFGISVMTLAVLLFIRVIVLLALVIFSPIGFIGTAIPWFSKLANQWWSQLMSNAFFGPSAALMLLVAVKILNAFQNDPTTNTQLSNIANKNSISQLTGINLANSVSFFIPIIFIWMSISVGKSFGIAGADKVIGSAQKFAKSTGKGAAVATWLGAHRGSAMAARNALTKKDKEGNVVARGFIAKNEKLNKALEMSGVVGTARRSFASAKIREEKRDQFGYRKNRRELLARMSENDLLKELHASQSIKNKALGRVPGNYYGLDADVSQAIIKKGLHKKLKSDDLNAAGIKGKDGNTATNGEVLQMLHKTLETAGDKDSIKTLESERADVMFAAVKRKAEEEGLTPEKVNEKVKAKVDQWIADGDHKKASNVNVMSEGFVNTMVDALGMDKAMGKIAEMPSNVTKRAEEVAEGALRKMDPADFSSWDKTKQWRTLGANVSSNAHKFFTTTMIGKIEKGPDGKDIDKRKLDEKAGIDMKEHAKVYAETMKSSRIEKLSGDAASAFATVATVGYFQNAGDAKLDSKTKQQIFNEGIKQSDSMVQNELRNSPKWKSYLPGSGTGGSGKSWQQDYADNY